MKHRLIVIDGLDGSGKQTQTERLTAALTERGYSVKHISFPDYNQPSSALVKMYLGGEFGKEPTLYRKNARVLGTFGGYLFQKEGNDILVEKDRVSQKIFVSDE